MSRETDTRPKYLPRLSSKAVDLMQYRARYREMSFEPYGIAVEKSYAGTIGIRAVIYGKNTEYFKLDAADRPYFQSFGKIGNWEPEQEYRIIGDFDLNKIPRQNLKLIVLHKSEKIKLEQSTDIEIVSLYK